MPWKCVNHPFGSCNGVPNWEVEPQALGTGGAQVMGTCKLNKDTCNQYSGAIKSDDNLNGDSYRHTSDFTKTKANNKKKKSKPVVEENPQAKLF